MKLRTIILALLLAAASIACEKEYEAETLPNYEMSGEWYVRAYFNEPVADSLAVDYVQILTSNTAEANGNHIWIDDKGNLPPSIGFKVKVPANSENLTFSGTNLSSAYNDTVTVTDSVFVDILEGEIIPDGGQAIGSGNTVDSIYIRYTTSSFPGPEFILAGHYRTGFQEDIP